MQNVFDANGAPQDWVYLDVNPAFEQLTGLKEHRRTESNQSYPRHQREKSRII